MTEFSEPQNKHDEPADPRLIEEVWSAGAKHVSSIHNTDTNFRTVGFDVDKIPWRHNLEDALRDSKNSGKPILADMYMDNCPPCRIVEDNLANMASYLQDNFVPLKIDINDKAAGTELARRYNVEYAPTLLVLDSSGVQKGRHVGIANFDTIEKLRTIVP